MKAVRSLWLGPLAITGAAASAMLLLFFAPSTDGWAGVEVFAAAIVCGAVFWIAIVDLRSFTIPDRALATMAAAALVLRFHDPLVAFDPLVGMLQIGLDTVLTGGSVLLIREIYFRRRGVDGIGFGDVKLAAVGGLLCGLFGFSLALLTASLAGLIIALAPLMQGRMHLTRLPFGTLLAPALLMVWALGA